MSTPIAYTSALVVSVPCTRGVGIKGIADAEDETRCSGGDSGIHRHSHLGEQLRGDVRDSAECLRLDVVLGLLEHAAEPKVRHLRGKVGIRGVRARGQCVTPHLSKGATQFSRNSVQRRQKCSNHAAVATPQYPGLFHPFLSSLSYRDLCLPPPAPWRCTAFCPEGYWPAVHWRPSDPREGCGSRGGK